MSSRRHRKGCIGADSLYKQEFLSYIVFPCLPVGTGRVVLVLIVYINKNFMSYIVFSCLPIGTGRVVSVLIVYINKNFCLTLYFHVFP